MGRNQQQAARGLLPVPRFQPSISRDACSTCRGRSLAAGPVNTPGTPEWGSGPEMLGCKGEGGLAVETNNADDLANPAGFGGGKLSEQASI